MGLCTRPSGAGGITRRAHLARLRGGGARTQRRRTKETRSPSRLGAARAPSPAPPPAGRGGARPTPAALPPRPREMAAASQNGSRARAKASAGGEIKGAADPSSPQHGSALPGFPGAALPGHRRTFAPHAAAPAFPRRAGRFLSLQTRRRLCASKRAPLPEALT